jgi:hypothetical protein
MKRFFWLGLLVCLGAIATNGAIARKASAASRPAFVEITKERLADKIKGGWAGQTIGCTYGGPTEFRWQGQMIPDTQCIAWNDGAVEWYYDNSPGLYDDIYMDLTFLDVFDRLGLDAPVDSFAMAFARAAYPLWHANQAARYNILQGVMPPVSGHWKNNPHADDIDYQIEADYSGLMCPGMPNAASRISDKIGHIMTYGNGWYGGVYVGAMYALAFIYDDIPVIVSEALKVIPRKSNFYECMSDIIRWHSAWPADWKRTWQECQAKWDKEIGCPEGVDAPFNIDARINCAYILIGLLYGNGDFGRTMDIATRCGQDSDCNPASACGILGALMGYSNIPEKWMRNLHEVENRNFAFTQLPLLQVYEKSLNQAMQMIERNGGKNDGDKVRIKVQKPKAVRYEESFAGLKLGTTLPGKPLEDLGYVTFDGCAILFKGDVQSVQNDYVARIEIEIDGQIVKTVQAPADFHRRTQELYWNYDLKQGRHRVRLRWTNPQEGCKVVCHRIITYQKK